jgi:AcrR family transcriptional regulator
MGRQARAQATRGKIIDAAVELFDKNGFVATGLGDIIEQAEITKGALYYHFDSKEMLAAAIIEEATNRVIGAFGEIAASSSPALENMVHGSFVVLGMIAHDKVARIGRQLARALGQFSDVGAETYRNWTTVVEAQAHKAAEEGDLRDGVDPEVVGDTIIALLLGVEQLSTALSGGADMLARLSRAWQMLLPSIADENSLEYFQQYLARESVRFNDSDPPVP